MLDREWLEQKQISIYMITFIVAVLLGLIFPHSSAKLENTISVLLGVLMFGMFSQIPFLRLREALANRRFMYALLTVNFLVIPLLVWGLTAFINLEQPVLLGVLLVLLAPCIDYVIVFTGMGRGDSKLMLVATPLLLLAQILLLPLYVRLFLGNAVTSMIHAGPFVEAFLFLIAIPLVLAIIVQLWAVRWKMGMRMLNASSWLPVPLMGLALFAIVASQISKLPDFMTSIGTVVPIYVTFMIGAPLLAKAVAQVFRLDSGAGRALIFSAGTRNSLVVLPLALALPEPDANLVAAIIVTQTIVELIGEFIYVRIVPGILWRD